MQETARLRRAVSRLSLEVLVSLSKHELKALEYRARAESASLAASACELERAREQHELAAQRWIELAQAEESRELSNRVRLAAAPTKRAGADPEGAA